MNTWMNEITDILQERARNKIETVCHASEILKGKLFYSTASEI